MVLKIKKNKSGFSLIEVMMVTLIAGVAFTSFYTVSTFGTKYVVESKNRLAAVAFANEKMEIVRNLAYGDIGTQGSIDIPGNILQEQDVTANGRTYHVSTSVRYFDDPMDGTAVTVPVDAIPNDYKIVRIMVSWIDSNGQSQNVSSTSRFVPPGLETSVGGSPLSINVIDGETLLPISQASVHITNNTVVPAINDTIQTNDDGHIIFPAAKISNENHLTVTKNGYETVTTMDETLTFKPVYGHVSVVENLNTYNYFLNKLSDLTVKSADFQGNPVGNVEFSIGGGKIIGHDDLNNNIFSMAVTSGTTDSATGEKKYANVSSGNYSVVMGSNTQYEFIDFDPSMSPGYLAPDDDMTYTMKLADKSVSALFLEVKDSDAPNAPIAGAKATLTDGAIDIFTEKESSLRGVVFYPDGAEVLEDKEYTLKVEADGYVQENQSITIDNLTHIVVQLTKI